MTSNDRLPGPLSNSYWIEPGRLLAGEYPGSRSRATTLERVKRLLDAGITYFLDLTEPGELSAYDSFLPAGRGPGGREVEHVRKPLRDHCVPAELEMMAEILAHLENALAEGHRVYLHCRAGIGRTGTVLGCYLVQQGRAPEDALDHLQLLWQHNGLSRIWPQTPETDEQIEYVRSWRPALKRAAAGINKQRSPVAAPLSQVSLQDRYRGALLGLAIGDALGASVQNAGSARFPPLTGFMGGGPFDLPPGAWTDDTAMTLCLAESLLERRGFDPDDQIARYCRWQREGHLSSTGRCVGITPAVARALATAQWTGKGYAGSHDPNRLDQEALVRVASVVLYFSRQPAKAIEMAAQAARTTHQSPVVLDACRYFASLLLQVLRGAGKQEMGRGVLEGKPLKTPVASLAKALASGGFQGPAPSKPKGTVVQALEIALRALQASDHFRDGALLAVNAGFESDVAGALYGQLAGALYGVDAIPPEWREGLVKRPLIEDFANRLLAAAASGNT